MTVLLTGATGFLGSRIAHALIATHSEPVVVLGRGDPSHLRARMVEALRVAGEGPFDGRHVGQLRCVSGDVTKPWLGLSPALYARLAGEVDAVWHCASDIALTGERERLYRVNVHGTTEVLAFARATPQRCQLVHISSVAVAGARPNGRVMESDLSDLHGFETHYDASKFTVECLVRQWAERHSRPVVVFRPSIVAADRKLPEGAAGHSLSVLGDMLEAVSQGGAPGIPAQRPGARRLTLRLRVPSDANFNIVGDRYATEMMIRIGHDRRYQGAAAHTFHVVHPQPTPLRDLLAVIEEQYPGLRIECADDDVPDPSDAEQFVAASLTGFLRYCRHQRVYDRSNATAASPGLADPAPIDAAFLRGALGVTRRGADHSGSTR
ncbi:SDR family oxidoreductase [Streptomyces sp. HNM0663]|uniref:SDR family oxidoreductase n=1 Tax=Streptomyces chengmaiensis TaxID=3040919 RepID=A0ABT6HKC9_9ACTN|nr:SDR family oxidoreductase [Streptomyces chengmaiensis]MDH2388509.1 SDR family oxidoreductase [Streptomyces chengmaiensis]